MGVALPSNRRMLQRGAGLLLIVCSLPGLIHGVRAGLAQHLYWRVKHGPDRNDAGEILRVGSRAHAIYPYNYNLCLWTAERALSMANAAPAGPPREEAYELVSRWCETGLALNPYPRRLRFIKMHLLHRTSVAAALRYWEEYVDWHFWEPYNHAVLVELYAAAGRFAEAESALRLAKGSRSFRPARERLEYLRNLAAENAAPRDP